MNELSDISYFDYTGSSPSRTHSGQIKSDDGMDVYRNNVIEGLKFWYQFFRCLISKN